MAAKWEKLDDLSTSIKNEPWSLYWSEMKTGSPEFETFLHNPLAEFVEVFSGVTSAWTVQTNILNHEVGLLGRSSCNIALVDPDKMKVYLTMYKHRASD